MNLRLILEFLKDNILFVLIPLLFTGLMLLKPFRKVISYCAKNIFALIFFVFISFFCSLFGYTISLNIFSAASALFLGLPGISLALFMSLVIWFADLFLELLKKAFFFRVIFIAAALVKFSEYAFLFFG